MSLKCIYHTKIPNQSPAEAIKCDFRYIAFNQSFFNEEESPATRVSVNKVLAPLSTFKCDDGFDKLPAKRWERFEGKVVNFNAVL